MGRMTLGVFCLLVALAAAWQVGQRVSSRHSDFGSFTVTAEKEKVDPSRSAAKAQADGTTNSDFPKLSGRVVDIASMLSKAEKLSLENKLAAFETTSSDQVVVATLVSLNGNNLEDYANRLFRHWQLGQVEENNGVLLLVFKNDRKIRIEVGYGLEGTLTDALSKIIIDQVIVPNFRKGDFGSGIVEGADMIINVLSGDLAELEARKKRNPASQPNDFDWEVLIFFFIWGILFFGPLGFSILAPIFGKKLSKHRYRWLGMEIDTRPGRGGGSSSGGLGGSSWSSGSSGGGFSGGGGSSGGGGASGGW